MEIVVEIKIPLSAFDRAREEGLEANRSSFILYHDDSLFRSQVFASHVSDINLILLKNAYHHA